MKNLVTILFLLLSNISFSQKIFDSNNFTWFDSLLIREVNLYRKSNGLKELKPSIEIKKITNTHLKCILDKDSLFHPMIFKTNEVVLVIPKSDKEFKYFSIMYMFEKYMKQNKNRVEFKKYINSYFSKDAIKGVELNKDNFNSFIGYCEKNNFYLTPTEISNLILFLINSSKYFDYVYNKYKLFNNIYIDKLKFKKEYLYSKENLDVKYLTKIILTNFINSPKHNEILLFSDVRNISTGSSYVNGNLYVVINLD